VERPAISVEIEVRPTTQEPDNFPDGIIQRDIASAIRVLEIVSSRKTMKLLVALKPNYLESNGEIVTSIMPRLSSRRAGSISAISYSGAVIVME
jgi:hypothetical protein